METVKESIYDHPRYYDLVFGADCAAELKFIRGVNDKYLDGQAKRCFEPACGTGRLLYGLAKKGFDVEGIDLNEKAVDFSNQRFQRHGLDSTAWVADMSNFRPQQPWDLAFNTINSFRHLKTAKSSLAHLQCMAAGTTPGGIYLLGFDLVPTEGDACGQESWSARRGHLSVITHMWTVERNPKKRMERFGIWFDIYTPTRQFRIEDELQMRSYTAQQFQSLIKQSGCWEIADTYDFAYDLKNPRPVEPTSEDVVYVLRRI